jgi:hypothetical protein
VRTNRFCRIGFAVFTGTTEDTTFTASCRAMRSQRIFIGSVRRIAVRGVATARRWLLGARDTVMGSERENLSLPSSSVPSRVLEG